MKILQLPEKPFDGKMKNLLFLAQVMGLAVVAAIFSLSCLVYIYVKFCEASFFLLFLPVAVAEVILIYINYLGRVKYRKFFAEGNFVWRKIDEKKPEVSLGLHIFAVFALVAITSFLLELYFFIVGFLSFNIMADFMTVIPRLRCISMKCPVIKTQRLCIKCLLGQQPEQEILKKQTKNHSAGLQRGSQAL